MATNLVSLVMQNLTPETIGRIASANGLDRKSANTAVGASIPALLAALTNIAAQPSGAQKLADAAKQHAGTLDNLASMFSGSSQTVHADKGSQTLSSLLGGENHTALTGAIAKVAGVGHGTSSSLLGLLAPVVMGAIAKQQGPRGIDPNNIASLFAAQKDNIAAALPSGMHDQLDAAGLLDAIHGVTGKSTMAAGQATRTPASAARAATDTGYRVASAASAPTSGRSNWIYWAVPAAAVLAFLFYTFNKPAEQVAQQIPQITGSIQNMKVGALDMGKQVEASLAGLRTSLQGVTDVASAEAAQSKLQQVTAQLDQVTGLAGQLSIDQRKVLSGLVSPTMPALNQLFDKVLATPGAADVLKPSIDAIKARLASLTAVV